MHPKPTINAAGFFKLSVERFRQVCAQCGADAACAYLVLAGGVDGSNHAPRMSTHGAKSVEARTGMSRRAATFAIAVLQAHGFIREVPTSTPTARSEPRWEVDAGHTCDVAICQGFLAPMTKDDQSKDTHTRTARLCDLYRHADNADMPVQCVIMDALAVFLGLHRAQDFGAYAGVSPNACVRYLEPISPGDAGEDTCHRVPAAAAGWTLVTEYLKRGLPECSPEFLVECLPEIPSWDDQPDIEARSAHALRQLRKVGLVYQALVVWERDPVGLPPDAASPLFTLWLKDSWADELETRLLPTVNNTVLATGTRDSREVYRDSRGEAADWERSGRYMYLIPEAKALRSTLLHQLRVRWWPQSVALNGLNRDRIRVEQWSRKLKMSREDVLEMDEEWHYETA